MEFCDEGNLEKLIQKKSLSEKEVLNYFSDIIDAFRYLREKNVIHRDIKPENVLIKNGVLKLADFGFGREQASDSCYNTIAGTPMYSAP